MKLALCHISDIHICMARNPVLGRANAILSAVKPRIENGMGVILVCSGDIAFSGKPAEYDAARPFLSELIAGLRRIPGTAFLGTVTVPGNHDCDFSSAGDARPILIGAVAANVEGADVTGESFQDLLKVQTTFFEFSGRLTEGRGTPGLPATAWTSTYTHAGKKILVRCLNTAILSQLKETPAQLLFPVHAVPEMETDADFALTVFHHPYPWLAPTNRRQLQRVVETISDLVITGHEHDGDSYVRDTSLGATDYVEGAALQGEKETGFNLIIIDLDANTNQIFRFDWAESLYELIGSDARVFVRKQSLIENRFELRSEFLKTLSELGTGFSHPNGDLTIQSMFVYPDLKIATLKSGSKSTIHSGEVISEIGRREYVHITGAPLSGRSTLARALYLDLRQSTGLVPVLIEGSRLKSSSRDELEKITERAVRDQYQVTSLERFRQLERGKKVLLIDDWHRCRIPAKFKGKIVAAARELFGKLVLFSDDASIYRLLTEGTADPTGAEAEIWEIQQFGYRLRSELVRKWHEFGADPEIDDLELTSQIATSDNILDSLVGKGIVPSWPVFILSVLQAKWASAGEPVSYGSYGHLYEALIIRRLAKSSREKKSLGQKYAFLSMLAYELFRLGKSALSEEEVHAVRARYESEYHVSIPGELMPELEGAQIWVRTGNEFQFRYKYAYYFFAAKYFQDGIDNVQEAPALRAQLSHMVSCVHDEDYANLLIFYLYLSKDREVIQQMLGVAARIYSDRRPARLGEDIAFVNNLRSASPDVFLGTGTTDDNRSQHRSRMDAAEEAREDQENAIVPRTEYADGIPEALKVDFAFRSLEVMGQVVKNFPLNLRGDLKLALTQQSYDLTLRTLGAFLEFLQANLAEALAAFERSLRGLDPLAKRSDEEMRDEAKMFMIRLADLGIYGMMKKLSLAVGVVELGETYHRIRERAGESDVPTRLIDLAIKLDHFGHIPEPDVRDLERHTRSNPTAYTILKLLVAEFLYLFPCDYKTQQRMVELFKFHPRIAQVGGKRVKKLTEP